jgi:hypothetical protein
MNRADSYPALEPLGRSMLEQALNSAVKTRAEIGIKDFIGVGATPKSSVKMNQFVKNQHPSFPVSADNLSAL